MHPKKTCQVEAIPSMGTGHILACLYSVYALAASMLHPTVISRPSLHLLYLIFPIYFGGPGVGLRNNTVSGGE